MRIRSLSRPLAVLVLLAGLAACSDGGDGGPGVIEGTINIASGTRTDADTALDLTTQGLDSSRGAPLSGVQNPDSTFPGNVILGGYVSVESGVYGNGFNYPEDDSDRVRLRLVDGQRVTINILPAPYNTSDGTAGGDPETRVELVVAGESPGSGTGTTESTKTVQAQQNGEHDLIITTTGGGPARYVVRATSLNQGQTLGVAGGDFLAGEAIVTMKRSRDRASGVRATALGGVNATAQRVLGDGQFRMRMPLERQAVLPAGASSQVRERETLVWIRELREDPEVASAYPNHRVQVQAGPTNQEDYDDFQRWHYELIQADTAWSNGSSGDSVGIAVLDTGLLRDGGAFHPDLAPNISCGTDCFDAVNGDSFPDDLARDYHGTHVAGIAGADASQEGDVTGVAHAADILPVRVLGGSDGSIADVIEGVRWVINGQNPPRADLINLSLGSQSNNPALAEAVRDAEAAGITVVGASGNAGSDQPFYPAAYPTVIAVGAVNCQENRSAFSNFGNWLDLVAPGGGGDAKSSCAGKRLIHSASGESGGQPTTGGLSGTSMAAPHVTGALALMLQEGEVDPALIRALIREGRITDGGGAFDLETGHGLLDAGAAAANFSSDAALAPSPEVIRLSGEEPEATLSLDQVGDPGVTFQPPAVEEGAGSDWFEVTGSFPDYRVVLDEAGIPVGVSRNGVIDIQYAGGAAALRNPGHRDGGR